jgi:tRNA nucleotidyltransferase (CCA-adding enzyme)
MSHWELVGPSKHIVRVEFNDSESAPGTILVGPFESKEDAEDFAQNWGADDTEIGDVFVEHINTPMKEEDDGEG